MIIKMQPKELDGKPIISEGNPPDAYLGRVIVEVWRTEEPDAIGDEPAFAWSVDEPRNLSMSKDEWLRLLLNGVKSATRHIGDVMR